MTNSAIGCGLQLGQIVAIVGAIALSPTCVQAQITPDTTLGSENSVVTPDVVINGTSSDRIDGGAIRGANLFHSFQEFNIDAGRGAYFSNPAGIENILSRVTGNNASNILGTLGVLGNANLFLMNPNGIIFGENSSLNVAGSFIATTANAIKFGEQGLFNTSSPNVPSSLLTVSPSAFLFNQINIGSIANKSTALAGLGLTVPVGESLLLVGGDIIADGGQIVAFGSVELAAVAGIGTVGLEHNGSNFSLSVPDDLPRADIFLTNAAGFIVSGGDGDLTIHTHNLDLLTGSSIGSSLLPSQGSTNTKAGNTLVDATGLVKLSEQSYIASRGLPGSIGDSGDIKIVAQSLNLVNASQVASATAGQGNGGSINIRVTDTISLLGRGSNGNASGIYSTVGSALFGLASNGSGGDINLQGRSLFLSDGALIVSSTIFAGNAGDIQLHDFDSIVIADNAGISAATFANAKGGSIDIETRSLSLLNGGLIFTSTLGQERGGNIRISTDLLSIANNGLIEADTYGQGNAGDLKIETNRLSLDSSRISASTSSNGNAGNLTVHASESVVLNGEIAGENEETGFPGGLFTQVNPNTGAGSGGDLTLKTPRLSISNGSKVQVATFGQGDAGELKIDAADIQIFNTLEPDFFTGIFAGILQDPRSQVLPRGDGGKVTVTTERLSIRDGGRVEASVFGEGNGGDIFINAKNFVEVVGTNENNAPSFLGADVAPPEVYTPASPEAITGNSGNLTLHTQQLSVRDGGRVSVSTYARGNARELRIQANDLVEVIGTANKLRSTISAGVERGAIGNGGDLTITTERMSVRDGARVSVQTDGTGSAGTLQIDAPGSLEIVGTSADGSRSELSAAVSSSSSGRGGNLKISTGQLRIEEQGLLTSQSQGQQNAGNIELQVQGTLQANNGEISTSASQASGGEISITAQDIRLHGDSDIQTNVASGTGGGGNITLSANSILAFDDSDILAFAQDGRGGNIALNTPVFFGENFQPAAVNSNPNTLDGNNRVDINATGAVAGVVDIPDVSFIQNSLTELPTNILNTETLVANSCVARSRNQAGSFLITGTGGLPSRPGEQAASTYSTGSVRSIPDTSSRTWQLGDPIVEPQGAYRLSNGQLILSRECS
ncbi:filamentous hemagglutinin N-terminal domain-containing protein [Chroococcidiopsis sp. TS-821]|uniref:two-partner secretion domain-containing protein n=1 Tax=Chroococcidiopsis sp. TS-821 TaxID=1378066 RepID=UPI000CEDA49B|nr:filamentous hemagglutinin N-terminal domain-containing protein [Chroococcidiopsis sp. TS-821]PPS45657.1 hypothetical protein B1A85_05280 [Chroococcidiopsis sp. TS-821]